MRVFLISLQRGGGLLKRGEEETNCMVFGKFNDPNLFVLLRSREEQLFLFPGRGEGSLNTVKSR